MQRPAISWSIGLAIILNLGAAWPAHAEEHESQGLHYEAMVREDDRSKSAEFDLSKKEDVEKVKALLAEGRIEELRPKKPVNILDLTWDVALWTVVVFLVLYFVLKKMAWGPMLEGLQKREHNIHGALEEAQKAREEAQVMRQQWQKEMERSADKVREIMDEARRDAQILHDDMTAKARAEIQTEKDRLVREMDRAKDQAVQELWNQSAHLATLISAKTIRRQLTEDDHRRLVDEAMAELGNARNRRMG